LIGSANAFNALGSHRSTKNFSPESSPPAKSHSWYLILVYLVYISIDYFNIAQPAAD
jgi:hypothetical protein